MLPGANLGAATATATSDAAVGQLACTVSPRSNGGDMGLIEKVAGMWQRVTQPGEFLDSGPQHRAEDQTLAEQISAKIREEDRRARESGLVPFDDDTT
jgi:hypothetical protein